MNVEKEAAALRRLGTKDLRLKYEEVFGESCRSGNKAWLVKRIAWRMQANADGDLSERARRRAEEIANDADLRLSPPKPKPQPVLAKIGSHPSDPRLPMPGTVLTRAYKGENLQVTVLEEGFAYEGERYSTLSAVAKHVTGSHTNGFLFFRLGQYSGARA